MPIEENILQMLLLFKKQKVFEEHNEHIYESNLVALINIEENLSSLVISTQIEGIDLENMDR